MDISGKQWEDKTRKNLFHCNLNVILRCDWVPAPPANWKPCSPARCSINLLGTGPVVSALQDLLYCSCTSAESWKFWQYCECREREVKSLVARWRKCLTAGNVRSLWRVLTASQPQRALLAFMCSWWDSCCLTSGTSSKASGIVQEL